MAMPQRRRKITAKNDEAARAWNKLIFEGSEPKHKNALLGDII